jgi:DNA-binding NarL/FixJ family response regulator
MVDCKQLIQEHQPDVAVLDIQMPKASGIEVTHWVRPALRKQGCQYTTYDDDHIYGCLAGWCKWLCTQDSSPEELIRLCAMYMREIRSESVYRQ